MQSRPVQGALALSKTRTRGITRAPQYMQFPARVSETRTEKNGIFYGAMEAASFLLDVGCQAATFTPAKLTPKASWQVC